MFGKLPRDAAAGATFDIKVINARSKNRLRITDIVGYFEFIFHGQ
jgi:hypothetical protein